MILLSYTIVELYLYYNKGAVDMQIIALLTRIQFKVSDTQVTCGPLVGKSTFQKNMNGSYFSAK